MKYLRLSIILCAKICPKKIIKNMLECKIIMSVFTKTILCPALYPSSHQP